MLLIAAAFISFVIPLSSLAEETKPERHFCLVDVSRSMDETLDNAKANKLQIRKDYLKALFEEHRNWSVTLLSFNTVIHPELPEPPYDLGNQSDWQKANEWVERLSPKKQRGTYLWTCLRKTLNIARKQVRKHSGEPVIVHVLTDGLDTEGVTTKEKVMRKFPDAEELPTSIGADRLGDFDIKISNPRGPSPTPTPTPTATATPSATRSPIPSPTPTATPSPTPSIARSPIATVTPSPTPTATPSPGPSTARSPMATATPWLPPSASPGPVSSATAWPATETVLFEIQEPRVVYDGQFVHFINKTWPPADSYVWTIRRNMTRVDVAPTDSKQQHLDPMPTPTPTPSATPEHIITEFERADSSSQPLVYQFRNSEASSRSYTVYLSGQFGVTKRSAMPITVVVQASPIPPDPWDRFKEWLSQNFHLLISALGSFLTSILTTLIARKQSKAANENRSGQQDSNVPNRGWLLFAVAVASFALCIILFGLSFRTTPKEEKLAAERSSLEKVARLQALSQASAQPPQSPLAGDGKTVRPNITISSEPSGNDAATSVASIQAASQTTSSFLIVVVTVLAVVVIVALIRIVVRQGNGGRFRNLLLKVAPATVSASGGRSITEQWNEIERLHQARIVPKNQLRAFKTALFRQLRTLYKVPLSTPRPKTLPALPDEQKNLIQSLITQTEQRVLKWKVQYDNEGAMDVSRFSTDIGPKNQQNETKVSLPRIEIYQTETGYGIAIFNRNGIAVQVIDRETFRIPADTAAQIAKLHEAARDSVFGIRESLRDILRTLGIEPKKPPTAGAG